MKLTRHSGVCFSSSQLLLSHIFISDRFYNIRTGDKQVGSVLKRHNHRMVNILESLTKHSLFETDSLSYLDDVSFNMLIRFQLSTLTMKVKSVSAGEYTAPPAQGPMMREI